jgi:hypothetical protein
MQRQASILPYENATRLLLAASLLGYSNDLLLKVFLLGGAPLNQTALVSAAACAPRKTLEPEKARTSTR